MLVAYSDCPRHDEGLTQETKELVLCFNGVDSVDVELLRTEKGFVDLKRMSEVSSMDRT